MDANDYVVQKLEKGLPIIADYCDQLFYGQINLRTSETILEQDDELLLAV